MLEQRRFKLICLKYRENEATKKKIYTFSQINLICSTVQVQTLVDFCDRKRRRRRNQTIMMDLVPESRAINKSTFIYVFYLR